MVHVHQIFLVNICQDGRKLDEGTCVNICETPTIAEPILTRSSKPFNSSYCFLKSTQSSFGYFSNCMKCFDFAKGGKTHPIVINDVIRQVFK